jgi:hypothetical protein
MFGVNCINFYHSHVVTSDCKEKLIVECSIDDSLEVCLSLFNLHGKCICQKKEKDSA